MNTFIITFIALSLFNVVFATYKSIVTIKGSKELRAVVSAAYFAFYNIMLIYTVADFPLWQKCTITFFSNLIGVYIVKLLEQKSRKDKLWKIERTVSTRFAEIIDTELKVIPHRYITITDKHTLFTFYCATQNDTIFVTEQLKPYKPKYFVTENVATF